MPEINMRQTDKSLHDSNLTSMAGAGIKPATRGSLIRRDTPICAIRKRHLFDRRLSAHGLRIKLHQAHHILRHLAVPPQTELARRLERNGIIMRPRPAGHKFGDFFHLFAGVFVKSFRTHSCQYSFPANNGNESVTGSVLIREKFLPNNSLAFAGVNG
jgi:hypothetical protein